VNYANWENDSVNYGLMANGQYDYNGTPSAPYYWAGLLGEGPHTLAMSEVFRYCFAIIGADNEADLDANARRAKIEFGTLPDKTPVNVTPASLGKVKALFK
jgi:hypothetical protein